MLKLSTVLLHLTQFVVAWVLFQPMLSTCTALAHSWYPSDCCSGQDCFSADSFERDSHGDITVTVGNRRIWLPRSFPIRPSPDHLIHICYVDDESSIPVTKCLFVPGVI